MFRVLKNSRSLISRSFPKPFGPGEPHRSEAARTSSRTRLLRAGSITAGLVVASWLSQAEAFSSMRCGNKLVSVGDSLYEVRATCGEPDQLDAYVEYRTVRERVRRVCTRDSSGESSCQDVWAERTVEVQMHKALYDFGRNRFIHYLLFEQGRLASVESGGYGKKDAR